MTRGALERYAEEPEIVSLSPQLTIQATDRPTIDETRYMETLSMPVE